MSDYLSYDHAGMWAKTASAGGTTPAEFRALHPRLAQATNALSALRQSGEQGFFDLPFDTKTATSIITLAKNAQKRFSHMFVIGIGGSDLGARTIIQALDEGKGMRLTFLGNPDPETLSQAVQNVDWKRTAITVISKSGSTLETMAIFMILRASLIKSVGAKMHAAHVYAVTDPKGGILQTIAEENEYQIIPHPLNVGGRFAVLSPVGLFPAACAGVNIERMLRGAAWVEEQHRAQGTTHIAAVFAGLHFLGYTKRKQHIHVLMPYADRLAQFGFWYRQLWAESLGKRVGKGPKHVGPTPIAALGAVDQHSQIQLYNEGLADKILTFIKTTSFRAKTKVPSIWKDMEGIEYIGGLSLEDIMHAELEGTADALSKTETPHGTLSIPSISPESLGALFQFYALATAYMGELFGVNTYNQPGVEEGKNRAKVILIAKQR